MSKKFLNDDTILKSLPKTLLKFIMPFFEYVAKLNLEYATYEEHILNLDLPPVLNSLDVSSEGYAPLLDAAKKDYRKQVFFQLNKVLGKLNGYYKVKVEFKNEEILKLLTPHLFITAFFQAADITDKKGSEILKIIPVMYDAIKWNDNWELSGRFGLAFHGVFDYTQDPKNEKNYVLATTENFNPKMLNWVFDAMRYFETGSLKTHPVINNLQHIKANNVTTTLHTVAGATFVKGFQYVRKTYTVKLFFDSTRSRNRFIYLFRLSQLPDYEAK